MRVVEITTTVIFYNTSTIVTSAWFIAEDTEEVSNGITVRDKINILPRVLLRRSGLSLPIVDGEQERKKRHRTHAWIALIPVMPLPIRWN
jgi:hypothetical protein